RRISRPLVHAAAAAHRLAAGERNITVAPEGPAEVADVADSLNSLAAALAVSEGRQRQFLLSISHELRPPLTAIRGFAAVTEDDLPVAFDRSVLCERYRGVRQVGTGGGLALVGALVGRLGGTVSAGHSPEGGAAFTVTLPYR